MRKQTKTACGNPNCNAINSGIDACIVGLVEALNCAGLETVASCCGHGRTIGTIALKDGREILIAPDFDTARLITRRLPDIHGNR